MTFRIDLVSFEVITIYLNFEKDDRRKKKLKVLFVCLKIEKKDLFMLFFKFHLKVLIQKKNDCII